MSEGKQKLRTSTEVDALRDAVVQDFRNGKSRDAISTKHRIDLTRVSILLRQAGVFGRKVIIRAPLLPDDGLSFDERTHRAKYELQRRKIQDHSRPTLMQQRAARRSKRARA